MLNIQDYTDVNKINNGFKITKYNRPGDDPIELVTEGLSHSDGTTGAEATVLKVLEF